MKFVLLAALQGCTTKYLTDAGAEVAADDTDDPAAPGDDDDDADTDTVDTTETGTTTPTEPLDCTLPALPRPFTVLQDFTRAEDFDFDAAGYHVSIQNGNLVGNDQNGDFKMISPNVGSQTAGTRVLATGDVVVADSGVGGLVLVNALTGGQTPIITNMAYPNGVEIDALNRAYVADQNRGNVRMVDVYTGEQGIIANGLNNPNGVILSPDEQTLYVGSFGGGMVYAIDRISDFEFDTPRILYDVGGPNGGFDGINVDACGNVYVTEYTTGRVYRVTPDGSRANMIADLPSSWVPNMRWGNDIGGWDHDMLYVSDRNQARLFVLEIGIPGKDQVTMP